MLNFFLFVTLFRRVCVCVDDDHDDNGTHENGFAKS